MLRLKLVPDNSAFNFLRQMRLTAAFSAILVLVSIGLFFGKGLNLGIDFRGGILIEAQSQNAVEVAKIRSDLSRLSLGDISIQSFGSKRDILIRVQRQEGDETAQIAAIQRITETLGENFDIRRTEFVGPTIGAELAEKGMLAVGCALLAIMIYIWFRFEWQFSIAAVIALGHDVISTVDCLPWLALSLIWPLLPRF